MAFLQDNIQKKYYFQDSFSYSSLLNANKKTIYNQHAQPKLQNTNIKYQFPQIKRDNETLNTQSVQQSKNILKNSFEQKYKNYRNLTQQDPKSKERSLTVQNSDKDQRKKTKDYQDFTSDGFNDYLDEVKRKNRKNNRLDREINYLIYELKDEGQEFSIKKKIKRKVPEEERKGIIRDNTTQQSVKLQKSSENEPVTLKMEQKSSILSVKPESLKQLLQNLKFDSMFKIPTEETINNYISQIMKGIKELYVILIRKKLVTAILKELGGSGKKLNNIFFFNNILKDNLTEKDFEEVLCQDFKLNKLEAWQDLGYFWTNMQEYLLKKTQVNLNQLERSVKEEQRGINELKMMLDKKQVMNTLSNNNQDTYQQLFKKLDIQTEQNRQHDYITSNKLEQGMISDIRRIERKYGQCEGISQQSRVVNQYLNESIIRIRLNQNT